MRHPVFSENSYRRNLPVSCIDGIVNISPKKKRNYRLGKQIALETARVFFICMGISPDSRIYMYAAAIAAEAVGTVSYFLLDRPADRLFMAILPKRKALSEQ